MSINVLASLFAQKSWANRELFDTVATSASPTHESTILTATRVLNHIYVIDRIFRAHLLGEPHQYKATNTPDTPDLGKLHSAVAETDHWYEGYVATLTEQALKEVIAFRFTDGDLGTMNREEMLFHVLTHGAYHRGNVGQLLKGISVAPPRDLFTKFLHLQEPSRRRA